MAQKYIVGDVVMYDNKIMVVKEPRDGSHFDLSCPKEGLVYSFVGVDEIKPMLLTSAILLKNGWNKVNMPSANVSLFRSILRTSKECGRCKHFNGMFAGRCTKLHEYVESSDWCHGTFFHRK